MARGTQNARLVASYLLWNCVILLVTFVFTPVLFLPDGLKPGDDLKLISASRYSDKATCAWCHN